MSIFIINSRLDLSIISAFVEIQLHNQVPNLKIISKNLKDIEGLENTNYLSLILIAY